MKFKILAVIIAGLALTGCETDKQIVEKERLVAVSPPASLFTCPAQPELPKLSTLTDEVIARYIVTIRKNYSKCYASNQAIKDYVIKAEARINQAQKP